MLVCYHLATNPKSFIKRENRDLVKYKFKINEDGKIIIPNIYEKSFETSHLKGVSNCIILLNYLLNVE